MWNELYDLIHKPNCSIKEKLIKYSNKVPQLVGFVYAGRLLVNKIKETLVNHLIRSTVKMIHFMFFWSALSFFDRHFYRLICMSSFWLQRRYTVTIVLHYIIYMTYIVLFSFIIWLETWTKKWLTYNDGYKTRIQTTKIWYPSIKYGKVECMCTETMKKSIYRAIRYIEEKRKNKKMGQFGIPVCELNCSQFVWNS